MTLIPHRFPILPGGIAAPLLMFGLLLSASPPSVAAAETSDSGSAVYFEDAVAPLLQQHCSDCHNADEREAMLDLSTAAGVLAGSDSGPVVASRSRRNSLLFEVVRHGEMPPEGEPLSDEQIEQIGAWIDGGTQFREPPASAAAPPHQHDVLPILLLRCAACHGAELQRGGLDLRSITSLRAGGDAGPAAVPGDPDSSAMIQRVESEACPPQDQLLKYFVVRPGKSEVETLRSWIAAGMPEMDEPAELIDGLPDPKISDADRSHWAFQPLPASVAVPAASDPEVAGPIDAFIEQNLREQGLTFSPPAERSRLIRRVYSGLLGVPPTIEELQHWREHPGKGWYQAMVDTLLASPRYGERWGRYWLDIAGYADSEGGQSEDMVRPFAWKYRDYVIRSFNQDKPWDRFLIEQLAGDELADFRDPAAVTEEVVDNLTATGFLRMGVDETGSRTMNFVPERLGVISDAIEVVSGGVMGLTMECARCHSHKYDPIPHTDYFRFKAIFQGAFDEHDWMSWKTRRLDVETPAAAAERETVNSALEKEIKSLQAERKKLIASRQDQYYKEVWPTLSEELQQEITAALKVRQGRTTLRQDELLQRYRSEIRPEESVLVRRHPDLAEQLKRVDETLDDLQQRLIPPPTIRALWDRGRPSPTYVLIRGEHERFGRPVGPGVPSVLIDGRTPLRIEPSPAGAESTGRRLAFARWLTEPDHPLTARVMVNRVWSLHFGRGIVKTLDNFGRQGSPPTHPELLDWLARDFIESGWSLKSLHRRILTSHTYRQSSDVTPERLEHDPENVYLSRMSLRRLDAEAVRDAVVFVSGRLDDRLFGPPSPVTVRADGLIMETPQRDGRLRRSIYLRQRRTEMPSLLSVFDYPEMQPNCTQRSTSTVALQSLILNNNSRIYELAGSLAARLVERGGDDSQQLIRLAYESTLSRSPSEEEFELAAAAVEQFYAAFQQDRPDAESQQWLTGAVTALCHTLINSAEFSYVD